jgi:hypothetical protein
MITEEELKEYEALGAEIAANYTNGRPFLQAVVLSLTLDPDYESRYWYMKSMGEYFSIPEDKVDALLAYLSKS